MIRRFFLIASSTACSLCQGTQLHAQRANENAIQAADDAFGVSIGNERIGLYTESEVRGFSPILAGNARIDGLNFDRQAALTSRIIASSTIKVGLTAQGYPFPAPTGIVDYRLREPGDKLVMSALASYGSFGAGQLEVDAQFPVSSALSLGGGVSFRHDEATPGDGADFDSQGLLLRLRPIRGTSIRAFWGRVGFKNDHATPVIFPLSPQLPTKFKRAYYGQPWAVANGSAETRGVLLDHRLTPTLELRTGLFQSKFRGNQDYADLYLNARADGQADHVFIAQQGQRTDSVSGEVRLTRTWTGNRLRQLLHFSYRARSVSGEFGGTSIASVGTARVGQLRFIPEPNFSYRPRDELRIRQSSVGIGYQAYLKDRAELSLGLQRTKYRKTISTMGAAPDRGDRILVGNAAFAFRPVPRLAIYTGFTRGLEENGTAPENAINFPEALPAARTRQIDAGVRIALHSNLRAVAGLFEVRKPYFNFDASRRFTKLGQIANRGVELSLTGSILEDLSVVAGVVLADPRVSVDMAALRAIGRRPVSLPSTNVRLSAEYRSTKHPAFSLDSTFSYVGQRPADLANEIRVKGYGVIDVGARYRARVGNSPFVIRFQVQNLTNSFGWKVTGSGGIQPIDPRRLALSTTIDL